MKEEILPVNRSDNSYVEHKKRRRKKTSMNQQEHETQWTRGASKMAQKEKVLVA